MPEPTPLSLERAVRGAYLRYYDTAYWLRDGRLRDERRALLWRQTASSFTEPLIEPVLPYETAHTIAEACAAAGVRPRSPDLASASCSSAPTAASGSRPSGRRLAGIACRRTLRRSATSSSRRDRARARPSRSCCPSSRACWRRPAEHGASAGRVNRWWRDGARGAVAARTRRRRPARGAAGDGPLPDQRARRGPDLAAAPRGRSRAAARRRAARLPSAATPGDTLGHGELPRRVSEPGGPARSPRELRAMEAERDAMADPEEDVVSQFPDPRDGRAAHPLGHDPHAARHPGHQLLDAQRRAHARAREPMFERRPAWLAADEPDAPSRSSSTSCTPTAARRAARSRWSCASLLRRLGLPPSRRSCAASPRAPRSMATRAATSSSSSSASTERDLPHHGGPAAARCRPLGRCTRRSRHGACSSRTAAGPLVDEALAAACRRDEQARSARRASPTACRQFADGATRRELAEAAAVERHRRREPWRADAIPFRAHHFVRMIRGVWACSNPHATQLPATQERDEPDRRTSAGCTRSPRRAADAERACSSSSTATSAATSRSAGSRSAPDDDEPGDDEWYLSSLPSSPRAAERPVFAARVGRSVHVVLARTLARAMPTWQPRPRGSRFRVRRRADSTRAPACLAAAPTAGEATGTMLSAPARRGAPRVPALPERCPRCDSQRLEPTSRPLLPRRRALPNPRPHDRHRPRQPDRPRPRRALDRRDARRRAARSSSPTAATTQRAPRPAWRLNHFRDLVRQLIDHAS